MKNPLDEYTDITEYLRELKPNIQFIEKENGKLKLTANVIERDGELKQSYILVDPEVYREMIKKSPNGSVYIENLIEEFTLEDENIVRVFEEI